MVRYLILLRIHENKKNFLRKLNKNNSFFEEAEQIKSNRFKVWYNYILKTISSPYITLLAPLIWWALYVTISLIIYAANSFQCNTISFTQMRFFFLGCYVFFFIFIMLLLFIDFLFYVPLIFKCQFYDFFFKIDPFSYRIDMISTWLMPPPTMIWGFVSLPKILGGVVTDVVVHIGLWISGGQMLFITIIKKLIFLINKCKKKNSRENKNMNIAYCISPEILDIFIQFCESEWSIENISFKLDVKKFKSLASPGERQALAEIIKQKYLIPDVSELEINAPSKFLNPTNKKILDGDIDVELFASLENVVDLNLSDN
jgi:hypothetical protein